METKTKGLTFMEAVEAMKDGKKVRLPCMGKDVYWSHEFGGIFCSYDPQSLKLSFSMIDATDWEIIEEKPFVLADKELTTGMADNSCFFMSEDVRRAYDIVINALKDRIAKEQNSYAIQADQATLMLMEYVFGFEKEESIKDKLQKEVDILKNVVWTADVDAFPKTKRCSNGYEIEKCEHEPKLDVNDVEVRCLVGSGLDNAKVYYLCKKCGEWY